MNKRQPMANSVRRGSRPPRVAILGVAVDRVDTLGACDCVERFVADRTPRQVVTVNPEFVMTARRDPAFRAVLRGAALATADGIGVVWAARILGDSLPERVGGVEVLEELAARAATHTYRLFLLGAREGVAAEAGRRMEIG